MTDLRAVFEQYGWNWDPAREPSPDQLKVVELGLKQPLSTLNMTAPQILATNYGYSHNRHILSMDKGMGKTVVYLTVGLRGEPEYVIIVCPTNAMAAQRRELYRHFPFYADKFVFVRGTKDQRRKLWHKPGIRVFICTMATFQTDCGGRASKRGGARDSAVIVPPWVTAEKYGPDSLLMDEFHKYIRKRSASWELLKGIRPEVLVMASGSATSGAGPHELWPALHLCDPKFWSSYWKYVGAFCLTEPSPWGKGQDIIGPKNIDNWRRATASYIFHRIKDPRDYPPKSRFLIDVELPDWQRKLHDNLREELWAFTDSGNIITARNSGDALYRARLGLICPKALDPSFGIGAGAEAIAEDSEDLSHVVISTPFRDPVHHLATYFKGLGKRVWILMGGLGIDPDTQDRIIAEFESTGGILIQTTKYATSYEFLHGPEHHYVLGIEPDPEDNKQAEDRFNRISSTRPSFHWYIRFTNTYEEDLVERVVIKGQNATRLMNERREWATWLK